MHDIQFIRQNPELFDAGLARRGIEARSREILEIDERRRATLAALQTAQARRNEASKLIGQAKAKKDEAGAAALMAEVAGLKDKIASGEEESKAIDARISTRSSPRSRTSPTKTSPKGPTSTATSKCAATARRASSTSRRRSTSTSAKDSASWTSRPRRGCPARGSSS